LQLYQPGDQMPSIRVLVKRTGLAHQTVVRALSELESEGYIDLVAGKGAFVARRARADHGGPPGDQGTVVIATPEWNDHHIWNINHHAMVQAIRGGIRLVSWRFWQGMRLEALAGFARTQSGLAGLLVLPPSQDIQIADADHLDALGVPVVYLHPRPPPGANVRSACSEPADCAAVMARHLVMAGHRRLAFIQNQPRTVITDAMVAGAAAVTADAGLAAPMVIETGMSSWTDPMTAAAAATPAAMSSGATGLIYTSSDGAFAALPVLRALGRRVPAQVSVIGSADHPMLAHADPPVTATSDDYAGMMQAAFTMIAGGPVIHHRVGIDIIVRASVARPEEQ
jgi:DNA-binding LacI/PurR family transcriptional regulator